MNVGLGSFKSQITNLAKLLDIDHRIDVADVGAAYINQKPVYEDLVMQSDFVDLHLFDGDIRQISRLRNRYDDKANIHGVFLGDGRKHKVYLCSPPSGMTSLLKPNRNALKFFNGFEGFGTVIDTDTVQTTKLDDLSAIENIDFLKLDIQGSEKSVLKHGLTKLLNCVAIQLEVSFLPLYHNQPTFGEIDVFLREIGYVPHRFTELKRWSIAPTVRDKNFRKPFNQLLEADVVYIKDPINCELKTDRQIKNLAFLSHFLFGSPDLTVHLMLKLVEERAIAGEAVEEYFGRFASGNKK